MLKISEIYTYPIKSVGGIALPEALVQARGLEHDRRFMLIDERGQHVSQREIPALATLGVEISGPTLHVFFKNKPAEHLAFLAKPNVRGLKKVEVRVFETACEARQMPDSVNVAFSTWFNQPLRLVFMNEASRRPVNNAPGFVVSFADACPFLLVGQASLDDLNARLANPLPMNRFRPNFVFTGGQAYEEDHYSDLTIGQTTFRSVKSCGRCIITTTDQTSGQRGAEPLKTLATYRMGGKNILFGRYLVWLGKGKSGGMVRVGDELKV